MPERKTVKRARRAKRQGKAPSTQAGEFVREEIHHVRRGVHGARSTKQAIAIGLSKARKAGVKVGKPRRGKRSATKGVRRAKRASARRTPSRKRSQATLAALRREPRRAASRAALSRQARTQARKRSAAERSRIAKKAARTRARRRAKKA